MDWKLNPVIFQRTAIGPNRGGSVCVQDHKAVSRLLQLAARSICISNRCIPPRLVTSEGLCEPLLGPDRQSPITGPSTASPCDIAGPGVENPAMVPSTLRDAIRIPTANTGDNPGSNQSDSTDDHPPQLAVWPISGKYIEMESFRRKLCHYYSSQDVSKLTNLMTHSSANGTAGVLNGVQIPFLDLLVRL